MQGVQRCSAPLKSRFETWREATRENTDSRSPGSDVDPAARSTVHTPRRPTSGQIGLQRDRPLVKCKPAPAHLEAAPLFQQFDGEMNVV